MESVWKSAAIDNHAVVKIGSVVTVFKRVNPGSVGAGESSVFVLSFEVCADMLCSCEGC